VKLLQGKNHRSLYKDLHINATTVFMAVNGHTRMFSPEMRGVGRVSSVINNC